jgi:hypothetical protein
MDVQSSPDPLLLYLEERLIKSKCVGGGIVEQVTLRFDEDGILAVVCKTGPDDFYVSFTRGRSVRGIVREIRRKIADRETRWQLDKYRRI